MMRLFSAATLVFAAAAVLSADMATVRLPLTGFLYDASSRSLRPVLGVPGSAYVGEAVAADVDAAWPSPGKDAALVLRQDHAVLLRGLRALQPEQHGERLLAHATLAAWDAAGAVAALYSSTDRSLQRLRVTERDVEVQPVEALGGIAEVRALAANAAGEVAAATEEGIYLLRAGATPQLLTDAAATLLAFGNDHLVYALSAGSVLEIRVGDGAVQPFVADRQITAFGISQKDKHIWTVDERNRAVAFDFSGTVVAELHLDRTPSEFTLLDNGAAVFLLHGIEQGRQPVLVLNATQTDPATFFVPASL